MRYRQAVAERNLANAEAQLRSQISALGKELRPFKSDTTSPVASALLNQQAVLKEQLAQMQVSGAVNPSDVTLVTPAQAPVSPSSPKPVQDALLGLAAGLALGLAAAFLRDSLVDKLASKEATGQRRRHAGAGHDPGRDRLAAEAPGGGVGRRAELAGRGVVPVAAHLAAVRPAGTQAAQPDGHQPGDQRGQDRHPGQPRRRIRPGGRAGAAGLLPTCAVPGSASSSRWKNGWA